MPLPGAGRALDQLPLVAEQHVEVAVVPLRRVGLPGAFDAAGGGVHALAGAEPVDPAQALLLDGGGFGFRTHQLRVARAVRLAEGVAAGDERDGLFVVHRHAGEGLAHVAARGHGVGVAVRALGVHVDQAHLHGGQRVLELAVAAVALVAQPGVFAAPVDVLLGLPDVRAAAAEAEGLEAHRLQRAVAGQDHEIGPGDLVPVLLLDGPEQAARLVQVAVVGPAVDRREALVAGAAAAAAVGGAVGAGAVPGHADEQAAVVAPVGRPPLLRVGHQRVQVLLQGGQIELLEFLGVVEVGAHRIGGRRVLVKDAQVQLVGPPVAIRCASAGRGPAGPARHRALAPLAHSPTLLPAWRIALPTHRRSPRLHDIVRGPVFLRDFLGVAASWCSWLSRPSP